MKKSPGRSAAMRNSKRFRVNWKRIALFLGVGAFFAALGWLLFPRESWRRAVSDVAEDVLTGGKDWPKRPLRRAGERLIGAVLSRDPEEVLRYASEEERKREHLDKEGLSELIDVVLAKLEAFEPQEGIQFSSGVLRDRLFVSQEFKHPDGRKATIEFEMRVILDDFRCDRVVGSLVDAAVLCLRAKDATFNGVPGMQENIRAYERLLPDLERLRLKGMARIPTAEDPRGLLTWRERLTGMRGQLQRLMSLKPKG